MIRKVTLKNFKCFEWAEIGLGSITLVTGLNGSGKSSFIQSLLLLRQSHSQSLLRSGKLAINGDLVQMGAGHDAFYEMAEDDEDVIRLELSWDDGVSARWGFAYDRSADVLEKESADVDPRVFDRAPIGGDMQFLAAERIGPRVAYDMSDYAVEHQRQLGSRGELAGHFLAHFGRTRVALPQVHHKEAASNLLIDQVEAWLGEVTPGVRLHVDPHRALDAVQVGFSFAGPHGNTNQYRPTNVGFGLSYTLSLLVATLAAKEGSLLIVENPEAHLHPRGQTKLTGLLASAATAGVQVIIETHSDHVLNGLRLAVHDGVLSPQQAAIHYFERRATPERVYHTLISPKVYSDGRIDPWPSGFFDEMENVLERLLSPGDAR